MTSSQGLEGGPEITIHKNWSRGPVRWKTSKETTQIDRSGKKTTRSSVPRQDFAFVNATSLGRNKDADVRKLVRSHVRNDYLRKHQGQGIAGANSTSSTQTTSSSVVAPSDKIQRDGPVIENIIGTPTSLSLSPWPINMESRTHQLLSRYFTHISMKPSSKHFSSNPLNADHWFRFAVNDPVTFHSMLYAAAIYLALLEGRKDSKDSIFHLAKTIEIVNERLRSGQQVDDCTIAALSCVAMGEANTGNQDLWHIHMRGIERLIDTRGTISCFPDFIQTKLRRTDITGAIDYAAIPYLQFERGHSQINISNVLTEQLTNDITRYVSSAFHQYGVHPQLVEIMLNVALFARSIKFASDSSVILDHVDLSDDMYWIEYRLLTFPVSMDGQESGIDKATRTAALLFTKAVIEEFPHSSTGRSILLQQLQESLSRIDATVENREWLIWLGAIGALLSKSSTRGWFVEKLAGLLRWMERAESELEGGHFLALDGADGEGRAQQELNCTLWSMFDLGAFIGEHDLLLLWEDVRCRLKS